MDSASSQTALIEHLADEFAERQRRGQRPSVEEYVRRYPELASEIREVFPALGMMEQVAPAAGDLKELSPIAEPAEEPQLKEIGDYRILREIGRGGMGVVYEAEQQSLRRRVALKVLPRELSSSDHSMKRFEREARAAARLHHTNIVPVFEVDQEGDTRFYAMQLIHGQGLDLVIQDLKRLRSQHSAENGGKQTRMAVDRIMREVRSEDSAEAGGKPQEAANNREAPSIAASLLSGEFQRVDLAAEDGEMESDSADAVSLPAAPKGEEPGLASTITAEEPVDSTSATLPGDSDVSTAESDRYRFYHSVAQIGLQTASALAYAHARGIIHRDIKPSNLIVDAGGVVWVTDFGLAKTDDEGMTHTGDILGTMRYMSPERFQGKCDVRADVYALGLTLYELLLLRPAFPARDRFKLVEMIRNSEPPSPRSLDPRIPRDLETIVLKSIDKDPKRRYQSADELSEDLRRFVEDKPIKARRASLPERLVRWSRRNRAVAASLAAIGLLLVATAIGSTIAADHHWRRGEQLQDALAEAQSARDDAREAGNTVTAALARAEKARYVSRLSNAFFELERGNVEVAKGMLRDAPPQYRNWPWGWLVARAWQPTEANPGVQPLPLRRSAMSAAEYWRAARLHEITRLYDDDRVRKSMVRFIPGSTHMVTYGIDGSLGVWDWQSGQHVDSFPTLGTIGVAMALSHNGKLLAVGQTGRGFHMFDVEKGSRIPGHRASTASEEGRNLVRGLWFSPDDKRLIVAYTNGEVGVVEPASGERLYTFSQHTKLVQSVRFLEGDIVLSASFDGAIHAWELETGDLVDLESMWHAGSIPPHPHGDLNPKVVRINPKAPEVAAGYRDGAIVVWNWQTDQRRHLEGTNPINDLVFSDDGTCLFVAEGQDKVRILDPRGRELNSFAPPRMVDYGPKTLALNPHGTRLATISHDGIITIWAPASRTGRRLLNRAHDDLVLQAAFSPDGDRIVTASYDGVVRVWDAGTEKLITEFSNHDCEVLKANFSPDGRRIASVDCRGTTWVWDAETGEGIFSTPAAADAFYSEISGVQGLHGEITNFSAVISSNPFTPVEDRLVVNGKHGMLVVDSTTGDVVVTLKDSPQIGWPVISPDGTRVAVITGLGDEIYLWDLETGAKLSPLSGHERQVLWAAFNADGSRLVTGSMGGSALLWDARTGERVGGSQSMHDMTVMAARFSRDGDRVASSSAFGTAKIWDAATGKVLAVLDHSTRVNNVQFNADGKRVLTTSVDNVVRLWDSTGSHVVPLAEYTRDQELTYATWGPDGHRILTCWGDGAVVLLEAFPWDEPIDDSVPMKEQVQRWRERAPLERN